MRPPLCAIAIHGGAGIAKASITTTDVNRHLAVIKKALEAGHKRLKAGATSLDAVEAAVVVLENSPLFNAGHGAVYTAQGTHEMDAAIMDGSSLSAGAVAGLSVAKNPIKVARLVMENTKHVLLTGPGANHFAESQGVDLANAAYFHVDNRWDQLLKARENSSVTLDHELPGKEPEKMHKFGTVGAVALDIFGNLAAATSTGGMTNKMVGRVGDSPIIGAGTYADNATLAISCTGRGEDFIRHVFSHTIAMRMRLLSETLSQATRAAIRQLPPNCGGFVSVNTKGQVVSLFNTPGMFRGQIDKSGKLAVGCF